MIFFYLDAENMKENDLQTFSDRINMRFSKSGH